MDRKEALISALTQLAERDRQMEAMKCCGNCVWGNYINRECEPEIGWFCDKWQAKEVGSETSISD
jgi:hypothetical protein